MVDGLTAKGLTTSPTSTTPEISITSGLAWSKNGTKLEGKTWYMLYDSTKTATLYCGGNTTHTLSSSLRHYGTGSVLVKSTTLDGNAISDIEDFPACESNSSFSVPYIMTEEENIHSWNANNAAVYRSINEAFSSSADTFYTVYYTPEYNEKINITYYPSASHTDATSITYTYPSCYYGKGAYYKAFYETMYGTIREIAKCPDNWRMLGWTREDETTIYTLENLIDVSDNTPSAYDAYRIYQIIEPDNSVCFGNSYWKNVKVYYGVNGVWKQALVRIGKDEKWLGGITTSTLGVATLGNMILGG